MDIFARHEYDVGKTSLVSIKLELKDPRLPLVREALRSLPIAYLEAIDREVDKLLKFDLIESCNSP
jgi:hypothetical protein